ncbi:MAG: type I secretion protein [Cereibacter sphaeroides]|uniref:Type I secretion protein n=1 Tax=Cereibacter sphaeroides TaxID=1063 RepID=A0A2W5UPD3_CERSP|nr:MAG: type I secretion protein [Cereibacter sphaeroides]
MSNSGINKPGVNAEGATAGADQVKLAAAASPDCGENVVTPVRDGIVSGTNGADFITVDYTGDPDGDRIDHNDSLKNFIDTPFESDIPSSFFADPGGTPLNNNRDAVLGKDGNDTIWSSSSDDVVYGGNGNDDIVGADGNDVLVGDGGNDAIYGGSGMDRLFGGTGRDYLEGGADRDRLFGGRDTDTLYGGDGNDDLYGGDNSDLLSGDKGDDLLDGGDANDTLLGGDGKDTLHGGNGLDLLYGGRGDDLVYGGDCDDTIDGGDGNDSLYGGGGSDFITAGYGDDLVEGGDGDDRILGEDGNDILYGGKGTDYVEGQAGNDTLYGGEGNDRLYGGDDADVFFGGNGDQIYGGTGGYDYDRLDFSELYKVQVVDKRPDSDGNGYDGRVNILDSKGNITGTFTFQNIEVVPCFTPGTVIATPRGEVPVEDLVPGDRVITRDNGLQEIRWTGRKTLTWQQLASNGHIRPILIRQGSLGHDLPERDMMVSPNHRMLVANERTALYFDEHEVLVAAKHLINNRDIKEVQSLGTTYLHIMFDRHEVVLANGAWTESFQPGDYSLKGVGNAQRQEIFDLFPELRSREGREDYVAARRTLKRHEAVLLNR